MSRRKTAVAGKVIDLMAALKESLAKTVRCPDCAGSGFGEGMSLDPCQTCDASGRIPIPAPTKSAVEGSGLGSEKEEE